jgi:asparagine synthetase B (glutamine-hydrolysing)
MSQGLETRVPFLDKDFLDVVMRINPRKNSLKHTIIKKNTYLEKHLKLQKIHIYQRIFCGGKRNNLAME